MTLIEKAVARAREAGLKADAAEKAEQRAAPEPAPGAAPEAAPGPAQDRQPPTPPAATAASGAAPRPEAGSGSEEAAGTATDAVGEASTGPYHEVSFEQLRRQGMITPDNGRSRIADEFRLLKRPLLSNAFSEQQVDFRHRNLIMVTSSLPGEGKTFCSINLAISMAMEMDRTVLLVDADVARPRLPEALGFTSKKGLIDVLLDDTLKLSDVMIRTNIEKLRILPSGRHYHRATELLASGAMAQLVDEMAKRYSDRIIIFDSPPLLATSEASVLATHMGQVVLVVETERTPRDAVLSATEQLANCPIVLPLLNKVEALPGLGYAQGYYGQYARPAR